MLTGAFSYLDSEYTSYPDGRGFDKDTGLAFGDDGLTGFPSRDFTGNRVVRTPKYTYTLGANQRFPMGPGDVEVGIDVYYNDGFFFYPQNEDFLATPSYSLWNARVSYFYDPWGLQLTVFGENVTDEEYFTSVFAVDTGRFQTLNAPRIFGARVKWVY